jgi:hypothetical protein
MGCQVSHQGVHEAEDDFQEVKYDHPYHMAELNIRLDKAS